MPRALQALVGVKGVDACWPLVGKELSGTPGWVTREDGVEELL